MAATEPTAVGIDLGGTNIVAALVRGGVVQAEHLAKRRGRHAEPPATDLDEGKIATAGRLASGLR